MSTVFVARDNALGRSVVVKVLPYELAATVSVDRFKREIMLSAALQHPHIVPVLSAGETGGDEKGPASMRLPFFIMPFVEGESLRARLSRGPLSVREGGEHSEGRRARARLRARSRNHSPRHQARQHPAVRRLRDGYRLRRGQGHLRVARGKQAATGGANGHDHAGRHLDRDTGVHGARTSGRRPEYRPPR
jgi:hypothetical protein